MICSYCGTGIITDSQITTLATTMSTPEAIETVLHRAHMDVLRLLNKHLSEDDLSPDEVKMLKGRAQGLEEAKQLTREILLRAQR